jgi:hypothetical protein
LNRAVWSSLEGARRVLVLLGSLLAPAGPLIMGREETLERRRGAQIQAQGLDREAGRAAHRHLVNARGVRWVRLRRLVSLPWATRVGAWPFLTVLAPAARDHQARGQRHTTRTAWARQRFRVVRRWRPARPQVVGTASRVAVMTLWWRVRQRPKPRCGRTRWRREAARDEPAPPRDPRPPGRPRRTGRRLPTVAHARREAATGCTTGTGRRWYREGDRAVEVTAATGVGEHSGLPPLPIRWVLGRDPPGPFEPPAWLCTALTVDPEPLLEGLVQRWRLEVTGPEARAPLGLATHRQGTERAMARTTPAWLGLCSRVTWLAGRWAQAPRLPVSQAVWSHPSLPTVVDALAIVRQPWWTSTHLYRSPTKAARVERPCALLKRVPETLCYAA